MNNNMDRFHARLQRIEAGESQKVFGFDDPTVDNPNGGKKNSRASKPGRKSFLPKLFLVFGFALMIPSALGIFMMSEGNAFPRDMLKEAANTIREKAIEADVPQLASFVGTLTNESKKAKKPIDFLPDAPNGWIRINQEEVQEPGLLAKMQKLWPQTGSPFALEDHPGYKYLTSFVSLYAAPDIEINVQSRTRSKAIYLNPNGQFMVVRLRFLGQKTALGAIDNNAQWIDVLATRQERELESGEIVERNQLADVPIVNLTMPEGENPAFRPIGQAFDAVNSLKISAPLTHRAVLDIQGVAAPSTAEQIIVSIPRPELTAQLD